MATNHKTLSTQLELMEEITRNAKAVQENLLAEILTQNANTEYLMSFNLHKANNIVEAFKSKVLIVEYDDIKPFIRRMADGDTSPILTARPISQFIFSSGTSGGEPKLFPIIEEEITNRRSVLLSLIEATRSRLLNERNVEELDKGKRLNFMFSREERKTEGGFVERTSRTNLYKSDYFKNLHSDGFTSPLEAIYCTDPYQSMYVQLLCGLYEHDHVLVIEAPFALGLIRAIRFFQLNWQQLTHDIRIGSLNPKVTDTLVRQRMGKVMRPDPVLADFIAHDCAMNNWEGIITRIWPHTMFLDVIITGTMSQYIPALDYYSGGLPKVSMIYSSSECYFGINLNPMSDPFQVSYTIMPNLAYFEFLPHEPNSPELTHHQLVDLVNVEIGKEYEIVVTTYAGLYRYRVGDILRVTGFHNSVPQVQFVKRKNALLSIDSESTDEAELQAAIDKASELLTEFKASVVDYTSFADNTTIPGHYVIYCELLVNDSVISPSDKVMEQCCLEMEKSLNPIYHLFRSEESIGPLEIRIVKSGSFEELMDFAISRGASLGQYKVPRCIGDNQIIEFLNSRVVSTHFSPSLP